MRYYPINDSNEIPMHVHMGPDEAFVVPTFELAEIVITRGADSARVAVSRAALSDKTYPGYVPAFPNGPLVPLTAFRFNHPVLIIIPTYNERENLALMIETISQYVVADVLIVDDSSPDGTGQLADDLSRQHQHVHVLHRAKKEGLGPAYLAGFQWALDRSYRTIIEMDCDFSHAPWDLPRMVHQSSTADLVIGSRYIPGGKTENWHWRRRLISRLGNAYISLFLGSQIRDWTGGFRCFRHELLARMNLATIKTKGYVFQVEMAWRALQVNAKVREIPIRFRDRTRGQSKLGWPTIFEALKEIPCMPFRKPSSH